MSDKRIITTLAAGIVFFLSSCARTDGITAEEFRQAGREHRMNVNVHHIPETPEGRDSLLAFLDANGYRGVATNVNQREYLRNEKFWADLRDFSRKGRAAGIDMWLYDEKLYPSGMADTYILDEHPDREAEGLLFKDTLLRGPVNGSVRLPAGRIVMAMACPDKQGRPDLGLRIDLKHAISGERLTWRVPAGKWHLAVVVRAPLYRDFQAATDRSGEFPRYTSLLMPEVTERFIELTHKKYAAELGSPLGKTFRSTFTDEPSLMALPFRNIGCGVYPWKQIVSDTFREKYGYAFEDKLPEMMFDPAGEGALNRIRYFGIVADLLSENYFGRLQDYCASEQMMSGGHLLVEESLLAHVPLYGDIMACYRRMDAPGIDVLTGDPALTRRYLYSSRLASSAAELENHHTVMSEPCPIAEFPMTGGNESPTDKIRGTLNRYVIGGVTDFNNYLRLQHEKPEGRRQFNEYMARLTLMNKGGSRASHIAVYYPIESLWANFRPVPFYLNGWDNVAGGDPAARRTAETFERISDYLYDSQLEFSYADTRAIETSTPTGGKLCSGPFAWEVLILPDANTVPAAMLERVEAFAAAGGKVIVLGDIPRNSTDACPDDAVAAKASRLRGASYLAADFTPEQLRAIPELEACREIVLNDPAGMLTSQKRIGRRTVFTLANDTPERRRVTASFPRARRIEVWNPVTGEVFGKETPVELTLDGYTTLIVTY